jgi:hypothetical protein
MMAGFTVERDGSAVMEETAPTGEKTSYRRMPEPKYDARKLAEFAGDYISDELGVTWRIEPNAGVLVVHRGPVPDITLQPVFDETFDSPGGIIRFTRGSNGRVTGLVIGAGRVTGFVFRKT